MSVILCVQFIVREMGGIGTYFFLLRRLKTGTCCWNEGKKTWWSYYGGDFANLRWCTYKKRLCLWLKRPNFTIWGYLASITAKRVCESSWSRNMWTRMLLRLNVFSKALIHVEERCCSLGVTKDFWGLKKSIPSLGEVYASLDFNHTAKFSSYENVMESMHIYLEAVKGRSLRGALDIWGSTRAYVYPNVPEVVMLYVYSLHEDYSLYKMTQHMT